MQAKGGRGAQVLYFPAISVSVSLLCAACTVSPTLGQSALRWPHNSQCGVEPQPKVGGDTCGCQQQCFA